jgi:alanine dehydrogenase
MDNKVILLTRADMAALMRPADYLTAVEQAFTAATQGRAHSPPPMHIDGLAGVFHAKGASLEAGRRYVALKFNGNFPGNPEQFGLPTIQGIVLLCDAVRGYPLAIADSVAITLGRTAAASALAARHLANADSSTLALIGCGDQALPHWQALQGLFAFNQLRLYDIEPARAHALAHKDMGDVEVSVASSVGDACRDADIIVTMTTAKTALLMEQHIGQGCFVAAVGADSPAKNEVDAALMASARIVVDSRAQCLAMGDLRHAVAAGMMREDATVVELADIVAGKAPGRTSAEEAIIFDSTGTALQDVAAMVMVYERALTANVGVFFNF